MARPGWPTTDFAHIQHGVDVQAELHALDGGVGLDVRLGRQVGIDAQRHAGLAPSRCGHLAEGVQFLLALDVEEEDAVLQGVSDLGVRLADAGEDDLGAGAARP